jgi:hypothetical protein
MGIHREQRSLVSVYFKAVECDSVDGSHVPDSGSVSSSRWHGNEHFDSVRNNEILLYVRDQ